MLRGNTQVRDSDGMHSGDNTNREIHRQTLSKVATESEHLVNLGHTG